METEEEKKETELKTALLKEIERENKEQLAGSSQELKDI